MKRRPDDDGVALVTVILVMLVGVVAAAIVASSVIFAMNVNTKSQGSTEAFIAAESGRDKVVSQIVNGCPTTGVPTDALMGTPDTAATNPPDPAFTAQAYTTTSEPAPSIPSGDPTVPDTPGGWHIACPTKDTKYVLIRSTGTATNGQTQTVDSTYAWSSTVKDAVGGVVTYFSGDVTQGVSHYTGDLVLRTGDWSCNISGVLDGDLYVLDGNVDLSNNCTVNGNIWASGDVTSNSSAWHINANATTGSQGNITANGLVKFTANSNESVAGSITAYGTVTLKAPGGKTATVGGTVKTAVSPLTTGLSIDAGWSTGARSLITPPTPFDPTSQWVNNATPSLGWLKNATTWIDLNNASGWAGLTVPGCANLTAAYIQTTMASTGSPIALDYSGCGNAVFTLTGPVNRDVAVIVAPGSRMSISLGTLNGTSVHNLMLVHSDPVKDQVFTCGNVGQPDTFGTSGAINGNIHVMVYTPCGLNGTVTASFTGQLYTNDSTHFHSGSAYSCAPMSWSGALPKLGCSVKDESSSEDTTPQIILKLGSLVNQTQQ